MTILYGGMFVLLVIFFQVIRMLVLEFKNRLGNEKLSIFFVIFDGMVILLSIAIAVFVLVVTFAFNTELIEVVVALLGSLIIIFIPTILLIFEMKMIVKVRKNEEMEEGYNNG